MRWRSMLFNILIITFLTIIFTTQIKGLSYRCENDQILIVQSFGNDTIRMHCQKLQLCGYSNLKCTYDREQPACGGKTNFVSHVNQLTPTGKVLHTCCDMTFKNNKSKHIIEHDGNDCFVYELPDGTTDITPGSEADIIKKNIDVVTNGFTVLKDASQIPEDFGGYTGYRLRLFMLRNKSPPLLIVKAIERTSGGYRVTICRPRCGKFNREGIISQGESISTFDKDISIPKNKIIHSNENHFEKHTTEEGHSKKNENNSNAESSYEESGVKSSEYENKNSSKIDTLKTSSESLISSKVSSESEKEDSKNDGSISEGSFKTGPKSGHITSVGKNGEWTAASWTSWTSNTWTTWSTQTWNTWKKNEKDINKNTNTRVRGQTRGDRVSTSELDKKIIEEIKKDIKYKGTDINDYDNLNSHETHEIESREKGYIDNRKVVIINHNNTTYNNYIHHGEKSTTGEKQDTPLQINNSNNFGNVGSSSNNSAKNKLPNDISQINNIGNSKKSEEKDSDKTIETDYSDGKSFNPTKNKIDHTSSNKHKKNKNKNDDDDDDNNQSTKNDDDVSNEGSDDKNRSPYKKPYKNRSDKKDDDGNNSNDLSTEKNNGDNGSDISNGKKDNGNNKKGQKKLMNTKGKDNKSDGDKSNSSNEKNLTDDDDNNGKSTEQNEKNNGKKGKDHGSKNKSNNNKKNKTDSNENKKTDDLPKHPETEGDEATNDSKESDNKISTKSSKGQDVKSTKSNDKNYKYPLDSGNKKSKENNSVENSDKNKLNKKPKNKNLTDDLKKDDDTNNNKRGDNTNINEKDDLDNNKKTEDNKKDNTDENDNTSTNSGKVTNEKTTSKNSTPINSTPSESTTKFSDSQEGIKNKSHIPENEANNNNNNGEDAESKEIDGESTESEENSLSTTTSVIDNDGGNENIKNEKDIFGNKNENGLDNNKRTDPLSGARSLVNGEENTSTSTKTTDSINNGTKNVYGEATNSPDFIDGNNKPFNLKNSNEESGPLRTLPDDNGDVSGGNGGSDGFKTTTVDGEQNGSAENDAHPSNGSPLTKSQPAKSQSTPMRQSAKASGTPTQRAGSSPKSGGGGSDPPSAFNALAKRNCFAADTIIETPGGSKRMDQLQIGDLVLVPSSEGIQKFEKVEMFYHRKPDYEQKFLLIQTESGKKLSLTELHLIPFGKCNEAINAIQNNENLQQWMLGSKYAYKIKEGECVISYDDNNIPTADKVIRVGRKISKGIYSPITTEGTIVTDGIFASCFSQIESQATQKLAYDIITMFYRAFGYLSDNTQQLIQEIPSSVDMLHQLSWYIIPFAKY
uniref:HintN domain-containing protein n=1 Tax=Strongyloides stercoralis TaxID=6248 RepID=A0A0K0EN50_STRER